MAINQLIAQGGTATQPVSAMMKGQQFAQQTQANQLAANAQQQKNAQALAQDFSRAAEWATTPEKWNQAVDFYVQRGIKGAEKYRDRFDMRDAIKSMGKPKTQQLEHQLFQTSEGYFDYNRRTGDVNRLKYPPAGVAQSDIPYVESSKDITTVAPSAETAPLKTEKPLMPISADVSLAGRKTAAQEAAKATEKRREEARKTVLSLPNKMAPLNRLEKNVNELINHPGLNSITGLTSMVSPTLLGKDARNAQAKVKNIFSQVQAAVLQMYKNMGPTGSAVGQVSNYEQEMFKNGISALEQLQGTDQFKDELLKIVQFAKDSKSRLKQAASMEARGLTAEQIMAELYPEEFGAGAQALANQPAPAQGGIKFLGFE